jgi:hypothetical protein
VAIALVAVCAPAAAGAASSRAEYIAQVDPICQSFAGPENKAIGVYNRNYKRWVHDASHGTLKNWVKQTRRTGRALSAFSQVHAAMTEQVAAIAPFDPDVGLITTWLNSRRQADAFGSAAAAALKRIDVGKFYKLGRQADSAEAAGLRAINSFGFTVCGVYA